MWIKIFSLELINQELFFEFLLVFLKKMLDKNNSTKNSENFWLKPVLSLFGRLTGLVVAPVLLAVVVGKWLDGRFDTGPWLFLITIGVSFIFSMIALTRHTLNEFKKIEEESSKKIENEE